MSNYSYIELAITNAINETLSGFTVEWPGTQLADSSKPDGLWYKVSNLRGQSSPVTLGATGEDNHPGIIQIDINYPCNHGTIKLLNEADRIASLHPVGSYMTYSTVSLTIDGSTVSGVRDVGKYSRISLSLSYYARIAR